MKNATTLFAPSATFAATLSAVNTAAGGMGAALADMLAVGHAEYLTFEQFRLSVKAGLNPDAWVTASSYMAPMNRAWENGKVSEFVETARTKGIKAARDMFKAGTGKKGAAPAEVATPAEVAAPVIVDATGDAVQTATSKADAAIKEAEKDLIISDLQAENAALLALVASLKAENAALKAEAASAKATKPKIKATA